MIAVNGFKAAEIIKAIGQPETLSDDYKIEGDPFASECEEGDPGLMKVIHLHLDPD